MSDTTERARRALTEETVGGIERFHSGGAMPGGRFVRERDYDALAAELAAAEERAEQTRRYLADALDSLGELPDEEPSITAAYIMSAQLAAASEGKP